MSEIKKKNDIEKIFKSSKIENILFITGKNSFYKTKANEFFKKIFKNKKKFYYFKKNRIPEFEELKQIIQFKDRIKPALIIAVGGGCVMDYAKIVSVYKLGKNLKEKILSSDFNTEKIKVLAIPTTAGSGAESTSNATTFTKNSLTWTGIIAALSVNDTVKIKARIDTNNGSGAAVLHGDNKSIFWGVNIA